MIRFFLTFIFLLFISPYIKAQPTDFPHRNLGADTIFTKTKIIVLNASKDTIEIADFRNSKKHGKQILFYNNGEISRTAIFKSGLLNGKMEYFAQARKTPFRVEHYKAISKQQKSLLHGLTQVFDSNNNLQEFIHYKNGLKHGKYELFHSNGKLREKGKYEENLNTGKKLTYAVDGILLRDENFIIIDNPNYIDDSGKNNIEIDIKKLPHQPKKISVLHGKIKYYYSNGQLQEESLFEKGKKEGISKKYYQNPANSIESEVVFKNGLEHGFFANFQADGNLERKGNFYREIKVGDSILKNVYDGRIEIYQKNGKRHRVENWQNFKRNGFQENYYFQSGELSERTFFIDDLKSGVQERFDKDGTKNYEAFFEIIEKDGLKFSQQTGLETYWKNGIILSTVEWENGNQHGESKSFYENGQVERIMHFKEGKLYGKYQTFHENGILKEDFFKQHWLGTGNPENFGWSIVYDEQGNIKRKFYAKGNTNNIIEYNFVEHKPVEILINNVFRFGFSTENHLNSLYLLGRARPVFGYDLYGNHQVRNVHFSMNHFPHLTANFTTDGKIIQLQSSTGEFIDNEKAKEFAVQIYQQFNPDWQNDSLFSTNFPDGKYTLNYADKKPFLELEFHNQFPHGKWKIHHPILNDTIFYAEFHQGQPIGNLIRKKIDGQTEVRKKYYSNHELKESYRFDHEGNIQNITKNDSLGNRIFSSDYYPGGFIKNKNFHDSSSHINFSISGDTLSYRLLASSNDSIIVRRQFFEGNKIKTDRQYNLTRGNGFSKTYYENGQLQTSQELWNDKPHGIYKRFDENGKLLILGNFKEGERDGKWIQYKDNDEEISFYKNGEISIEDYLKENETNEPCRCFDTSLAGGKIGFANSLSYFVEYEKIKPFIPNSIIPVDEWNYDKIFYLNLRTTGDMGSTNFKLLFFQEFSFYYPFQKSLKFNLNPCPVQGYLGNIEANIHYNVKEKKLMFSQLETKRISVSLENNPLENAFDGSNFTSYFDTKIMNFDANGIQAIHFANDLNACFPLGIINDFMNIEIETAKLEIHPQNRTYSFAPLMPNELKQFYGLDIQNAKISFQYDSIEIEAETDQILAGSNYVAGRIFLKGNSINENEFNFNNQIIDLANFIKNLEQNGFYRVKTEVVEDKLFIEFFTEK